MPAPPLFHFCNRSNLSADEADVVLCKILSSRRLRSTKWKIVKRPESDLELVEDAENLDPELVSKANAGIKQANLQLNTLGYRMVCLAELKSSELSEHMATFGKFGVAIKQGSPPARECEPVQYVTNRSRILKFFSLNQELIRSLRAVSQDQDQKILMGIDKVLERFGEPPLEREKVAGSNAGAEAMLKTAEELSQLRMMYCQSAVHSAQREWRFISTSENKHLEFAPKDLEFIVVDTDARAQSWRQSLREGKRGSYTLDGFVNLQILSADELVPS